MLSISSEVFNLSLLSLAGVSVGFVYWFTPFFTKRLIGENDPFEKKIFGKNLPFWQFMMLTVFFPIFSMIVISWLFHIDTRPALEIIPISKKITYWLLIVIISIIGYGIGSHGTSVSIGHYMSKYQSTKAYGAVEFYHQIFSHFLVIIGLLLAFLVIALYELNFPYTVELSNLEMTILAIGGALMGVVLGFIVIEGRGKYYGIPTMMILLFTLIFLVYDLGLNIRLFPSLNYVLWLYAGGLMTIFTWRLKNGELRETMGDFFHEDTDE